MPIVTSLRRAKDIERYVVQPLMDILYEMPKQGYQPREGQETMALDIAEAVRDGDNLIVEAGVGIGKSFGYLLPSILLTKFWNNRFVNRPVIIATSSIQLSEQLYEDSIKASQITGIPIKPVVGKGRNNYVCLERIQTFATEKHQDLLDWAIENKTGDRSHLPFAVSDRLWNQINVDQCKHERCDSRFECHFYKMRRDISDYTDHNVIIVNQDLLIAHLLKMKESSNGKGVLHRSPCVLIIDEAHNLEEKTRNKLTLTWTKKSILHQMKQIRYHLSKSELFDTYQAQLAMLNEDTQTLYQSFWDDIRQTVQTRSTEGIERFFVKFPETLDWQKMKDALQNLSIGLTLVDSKKSREIDELVEYIDNFIDFLEELRKGDLSRYVFWGESDLANGLGGVSVSHAPKNISSILRDMLFNQPGIPVVLTSATLSQIGNTVEEQYVYQRATIGYTGQYSEPKPSPFNYEDNARLYVPNHIAAPNIPEKRDLYLEQISEEIIQLANVTNGRTLVLFTAKEDLKQVHAILHGRELSWQLLTQKEGASQSSTISEFRHSKGVLLATGVFWEGINIDGPDLSQVIITRLPFPVPDPIMEYKTSLSSNPMRDILLPEMIIKLRQGVGRLIRSETDKGILAILDSRISQNPVYAKEYRDQVLASIPIRRSVSSISELNIFMKPEANQRKRTRKTPAVLDAAASDK